MKFSWHIQLTPKNDFMTTHAHIDCTLLTSGLPQQHKDNVYIYPPQVKRMFTLCRLTGAGKQHSQSCGRAYILLVPTLYLGGCTSMCVKVLFLLYLSTPYLSGNYTYCNNHNTEQSICAFYSLITQKV